MKITKETINIANINFISVEELIFLHTRIIGEDWEIKISPNSISKLVRMGFLKDINTITPTGETVVGCCDTSVPIAVTKSGNFEEFWKAYPQHDGHDKFLRSRLLRLNKLQTNIEYNLVISSGVNPSSLLKALLSEIKFRSQPGPNNAFKYMKNSVNYLKTQAYMDYMDFENEETRDEYGKSVI
jgi:hypothetical protein